MHMQIGKKSVNEQAIFKVLFPIFFIATLALCGTTVYMGESLLTMLHAVAIGSTYASYRFANTQQAQ